jgi:hypothetical protein
LLGDALVSRDSGLPFWSRISGTRNDGFTSPPAAYV